MLLFSHRPNWSGWESEVNVREAWDTRYARWQFVVALGFTVLTALAWVS